MSIRIVRYLSDSDCYELVLVPWLFAYQQTHDTQTYLFSTNIRGVLTYRTILVCR